MTRCQDCGARLALMQQRRCPLCREIHRRCYWRGRKAARRDDDVVPGDLPAAEIERRIEAHLAKLRKARAA